MEPSVIHHIRQSPYLSRISQEFVRDEHLREYDDGASATTFIRNGDFLVVIQHDPLRTEPPALWGSIHLPTGDALPVRS